MVEGERKLTNYIHFQAIIDTFFRSRNEKFKIPNWTLSKQSLVNTGALIVLLVRRS